MSCTSVLFLLTSYNALYLTHLNPRSVTNLKEMLWAVSVKAKFMQHIWKLKNIPFIAWVFGLPLGKKTGFKSISIKTFCHDVMIVSENLILLHVVIEKLNCSPLLFTPTIHPNLLHTVRSQEIILALPTLGRMFPFKKNNICLSIKTQKTD